MAETHLQPELFTYNQLPEEEANWLRTQEEHVVNYCRRTLLDHITVGEALIEVHRRYPRHFKPWLDARTPLSRSTAYCLMSVAQHFSAEVRKLGKVSAGRTQFEVKALYALSQPNVPKQLREKAVASAQLGPYTLADARKEIRTWQMRNPKPVQKKIEFETPEEKQDRKDYEAKLREIFDETKAAPPDTSRPAVAIRNLQELCRITTTLNISIVDDPDDPEPLYSVRAIFRDRDRQMPPAAVRADLIDAIAALVGREEMKECPQCGQTRPISWFVANRTKKDGRASECKDCSRGRTRELKARAKANRSQAA